MFELSLPKLLLIALLVLVLFGRGKVADLMGEFGKGVKNFKQGMGEGEKAPLVPPSAQITANTRPAPPAPTAPAGEQKFEDVITNAEAASGLSDMNDPFARETHRQR